MIRDSIPCYRNVVHDKDSLQNYKRRKKIRFCCLIYFLSFYPLSGSKISLKNFFLNKFLKRDTKKFFKDRKINDSNIF